MDKHRVKSKDMMPIKWIAVISLTMITAFVIFFLGNTEPLENKKLFEFPLKIEKWLGEDVSMEEWVFEALETSYAILRNYQTPDGEIINFSIVWYNDKEIAFHSAAACLGGSGDKVKEDLIYPVIIDNNRKVQIGKLLTDKFRNRRIVLYYYISDGFINGSQVAVRKHVVKNRLLFKRASAAFVRIMMPVYKDEQYTQKRLEEFLRATLPYVEDYTVTPNK